MTIRHVILDRDGVLNQEPATGWVTAPADWRWERGALEGLRALCAGRRVSVATNQSCVGRGLVPRAAVDALHAFVVEAAAAAGARIDEVLVCPHAPDAGCACRKPAPGLLLHAVLRSGVGVADTLFVGDAATDLEAGRRAGVATVLVRTGKGASTEPGDAPVFDDLRALAAHLGDAPGAS